MLEECGLHNDGSNDAAKYKRRRSKGRRQRRDIRMRQRAGKKQRRSWGEGKSVLFGGKESASHAVASALPSLPSSSPPPFSVTPSSSPPLSSPASVPSFSFPAAPSFLIFALVLTFFLVGVSRSSSSALAAAGLRARLPVVDLVPLARAFGAEGVVGGAVPAVRASDSFLSL